MPKQLPNSEFAKVDQAKDNPVVKEQESRFGAKYEIEGTIKTPDGRVQKH